MSHRLEGRSWLQRMIRPIIFLVTLEFLLHLGIGILPESGEIVGANVTAFPKTNGDTCLYSYKLAFSSFSLASLTRLTADLPTT